MLLIVLFYLFMSGCEWIPQVDPPSDDPVDIDPPGVTMNICFIHHSVGSDWLKTGLPGLPLDSRYGNLGSVLNENNYYLSDATYGWIGPDESWPWSYGDDPLGDHTSFRDWQYWFNDTTMPYIYNNVQLDPGGYPANSIPDPGGANTVILFKSCYHQSAVEPPLDDEKAYYTDLLDYTSQHTDKLFILITSPPRIQVPYPESSREMANWLADRETGWLGSYQQGNVYAFDLYNILSNPQNHHWINDGIEEHIVADDVHNLHYYSGTLESPDSHPNSEGLEKATAEFVPLLNTWYNLWNAM